MSLAEEAVHDWGDALHKSGLREFEATADPFALPETPLAFEKLADGRVRAKCTICGVVTVPA